MSSLFKKHTFIKTYIYFQVILIVNSSEVKQFTGAQMYVISIHIENYKYMHDKNTTDFYGISKQPVGIRVASDYLQHISN